MTSDSHGGNRGFYTKMLHELKVVKRDLFRLNRRMKSSVAAPLLKVAFLLLIVCKEALKKKNDVDVGTKIPSNSRI